MFLDKIENISINLIICSSISHNSYNACLVLSIQGDAL